MYYLVQNKSSDSYIVVSFPELLFMPMSKDLTSFTMDRYLHDNTSYTSFEEWAKPISAHLTLLLSHPEPITYDLLSKQFPEYLI